MNESPIRRFCESPHRKLIVVIVTTVLGLVVLIPLVDEYFDNEESHNTLTEDLGRARQTAEGISEVEKQVEQVTAKLAEIEGRAITGDSLSAYRNKVVDLVREAGCQVRRFDVSSPVRRPWMRKDNPLELKAPQQAKNPKTPFSLERRNVVLLVDGPLESLQALLGQIYKDDSMAYLHRLEFQAAGRGSEQVTLEVELWLFALGRSRV